ncbi:MAG: 16S rRNA (cytidine(1402)-2'-O)-methyltransferase [Flavobacteriales bacterium]|nr:16S rRNA (cytidine(1402)-2'-O)-methyltransferase [Flavobacteriales bacterium]
MSKLYLVPTPVGNLGDMTFRAIQVLKEVDGILAEDTRTSGKLLRHFEIENSMIPFHAHNEHRMLKRVIERLQKGETLALISDAGTPGISDPGFLLVRACAENGIDVETLPGATAVIPALVNSGLPADRFCFEGFLPPKKGRNKRLMTLVDEERTMIFYESPHRIVKTLVQFAEFFGEDRQAALVREISKIHEETVRGTLEELVRRYSDNPPKGEIALIIQGNKA